MIAKGLIQVTVDGGGKSGGLMTLEEGTALKKFVSSSPLDQLAVDRIFEASLNSGLGGGTLEIRARRGSAAPVSFKIKGSLSQAHQSDASPASH